MINSIKRPNAAVIIWNYDERLDDYNSPKTAIDKCTKIVCLADCISIQTSKSKSNPVGSFQVELAPTKNWVSNITAGSWCVILMSNDVITNEDLKKVNPNQLRMIGKIETVRISTFQADDARLTKYFISGVDWGHLFNNYIHIDPLNDFERKNEKTMSSGELQIQQMLFPEGKNKNEKTQIFNSVTENLRTLLKIFTGKLNVDPRSINRFAKSVYTIKLPSDMQDFLNLKSPFLNNSIRLITGALKKEEDKYVELGESIGFINVTDLIGTNSLWQTLNDNSSPVINEMFSDIKWEKDRLVFALYNRIKPFSIQATGHSVRKMSSKEQEYANKIRSFFIYVKAHNINSADVIDINLGTNWRDKYNYVEIRPQWPQFNVIGGLTGSKLLEWDSTAWNREGFRPMILQSKQVPRLTKESKGADWELLASWAQLLREWFFDTHRLLNGSLRMVGSSEYICVGNNIKFDLELVMPSENINSFVSSNNQTSKFSILAHVENISNSFTVDDSGARSFMTQIDFVRGIIVHRETNKPVQFQGKLDEDVTKNPQGQFNKEIIVSKNKT